MDCIARTVELSVLNEISKCFTSDDFKGLLDEESISIVNNSLSNGCLHSIFDALIVKRLTSIDLVEDLTKYQLEMSLKEQVSQYLESTSEDEKVLRHVIILLIAVANLKVFVEHNWVGPPLVSSLIWPDSSEMLKKSDDWLRSYMTMDGEDVTVIASNLAHLFLAHLLLTQFKEELALHCKTSKFWLIRCLWIQQVLYSERLPTLENEILQLIGEVENSNNLFMANAGNPESFMQFHLESCHINYFFYKPNNAQQHMEKAREASGLSVDLTGALGKRTVFQVSSLPQLILKVEKLHLDHHGDGTLSHQRDPGLPKNLTLKDETVLERIQLEDPEAAKVPNLTALEQCFILGLCYHYRRGREGQGSVIKEETMAYINCVLSQPQSWCVETMALFMRCRWECEGTRYLQRSLSQLEELSDQYSKPSKQPINRISFIFSSILPPHWTIERELGEMLDNLGLTKSAVEVFERLQMWDDIIRCHVSLNNRNKAEALIRQQLSTKETPLLWCFLGDITRDEECYQKSWELSGHKFARSQRSLALCHVGRKEFEKSLEYFERCLSINPLQIGVWFSYGCAGLACGQYDKAAIGFRGAVNLDSDNFEAWTNLATAYIRAKNKPRAFLALQEALKCEYDNWKIWENYLIVSVDIGQFEETMRAYHRLLNLKENHEDVEVLTILTNAVCENMKDATGQDSSRLKPKLLDLFDSIVSKPVINNTDVWRQYARMMGHVEEGQTSDESSLEKVIEFLQKSHRESTSLTPRWEKEPEKCVDVCKRTACLAKAYKSYLSVVTEEEQKSRIVSAAKLTINRVIVATKRSKMDFLPGPTLDNLDRCLLDLEDWIGSDKLFGCRQFQSPNRLTFDSSHNEILVADHENNKIFTYDVDGKFVRYSGSECESRCGISVHGDCALLALTTSNPDASNVQLYSIMTK